MKRHLSAALLLPLLYLYITKLPPVYFLLLASAVSVMAQWEFSTMYRARGPLKYAGIALGMIILIFIYLKLNPLFTFALSFAVVALMRLFMSPGPPSALSDIAPVLVGLVYIPGLLGFQVALREAGHVWIVLLYGCIWASDSMAYYFGKGIKGRKLYPEVSPKKTVAGAVGSVAGGLFGALIIRGLFFESMSAAEASMLGAITGTVAILGDLVESMFKRDAGIKDSSPLIPGHGGVLDKLDSALFAGPVIYFIKTVFLQ